MRENGNRTRVDPENSWAVVVAGEFFRSVDVLLMSLASEHQRVWHAEKMIGYTSLDAHVAGFGHSSTPKQDVCDV
jgi:hypothetical protein